MAFQDLHKAISVDLENNFFAQFSSSEVFLSFLNLMALWILVSIAGLLFFETPPSTYNIGSEPTSLIDGWFIYLLGFLILSIIIKFLRVSIPPKRLLGHIFINIWLLFSGWVGIWTAYLISQNSLLFSVLVRLTFVYQLVFNLLVIWPLSIVLFLCYLRVYITFRRMSIQIDKINDQLIEKSQEGLTKNNLLQGAIEKNDNL